MARRFTDSGVPPHAMEAYAPAPRARRDGIGLCLSGGGFRAALFHLGALRRLDECALLAQLRTVSAVSGGAILAAHLATAIRWPVEGPTGDWEERVAAPFRRFASRNIRTRPLLGRLLPHRWLDSDGAVNDLAGIYRKQLTPLRLDELPLRPNFIFCATDMSWGVNWVFERGRMGDYQAGYVSPVPPEWSVARAVAASSCFPPVFNPMSVALPPERFSGGEAEEGAERTACIERLRLTDGGNYDNMGLEPVWKDHSVVLVSDGGATFDAEGDGNLFRRLSRYTEIVEKQALALRKRWLISGFMSGVFDGTYWGIASATESYGASGPAGYSKRLASRVIAEVRTDLDAFSEAECAVLENHGYLLADAALRRHLPASAAGAPAASIPHPQWMDEGRVRAGLATSHVRSLLGRSAGRIGEKQPSPGRGTTPPAAAW